MVDHNTTDEEQIAALKAAWREHGRAILTGIVLGVCLLVGWNYWQTQKIARAQEGAEIFTQMQKAVDSKDTTALNQGIEMLEGKYSSTPYLALGKMAQAKLQAESGDYAAAQTTLEWVMSNAPSVETRELAKLRLASVHNASGQPEQALSLLESGISSAFEALANEHRGDAYQALGKSDEARSAYDNALEAAPNEEYLRWKRDSLGEATAVAGNAS